MATYSDFRYASTESNIKTVRLVVYETSKTSDRNLITKATDTFIDNRKSILSSYIFSSTDRKLVQNYYPRTLAKYRFIYQKSPHEFITRRYFTFGLKMPPNSIRKIASKSCPKAISDRIISYGTPYIPYIHRMITLRTQRSQELQILKYPDYFRWNYLPNAITEFRFCIKFRSDIDWNSLKVFIEENNAIKYILTKENFDFRKIRNDIYELTYKDNQTLLFNENSVIKIKIYLIDTDGNYLSDILY